MTPRLKALLDAFEEEVKGARSVLENRGKGGQQCSPSGDFINVNPSTLNSLEWWVREFQKEIKS